MADLELRKEEGGGDLGCIEKLGKRNTKSLYETFSYENTALIKNSIQYLFLKYNWVFLWILRNTHVIYGL